MIRRLFLLIRLAVVTGWLLIRRSPQKLSSFIFKEFIHLGGVYIKFLQLLVLRANVFADIPYHEQLKVFDTLPTDRLNVAEILEQDLGERARQFAEVEPEPFASGSFAQVYKARLRDSQAVVIKVLRPELKKTLRLDLKILKFASKALGLFGPRGLLTPEALFKEFKEITEAETDYNREVQHAVAERQRHASDEHIVVPRSFPELSSHRIITQEYIDGLALTDVLKAAEGGVDVEQLVATQTGSHLSYQLQVLGFNFLYGVFAHDKVHGDPHPGNIFLLPNNKIALIDFGIVAQAPADKAAFLQLVRGYRDAFASDIDVAHFGLNVIRFFGGELYQALEALDERSDLQRIEILREAIKNEASRSNIEPAFMTHLIHDGHISEFFSRTLNADNRFSLNLQIDGAATVRAAMVYNNLLARLNLRTEVMSRVYAWVVQAIEQNPQVYPYALSEMDHNRAVEVVGDWLDELSLSHPRLFQQLNQVNGYA